MARYATGAHTKHRLQYYIVWIPKYRKRALRGKIAIRVKRLLHDACNMNGWQIREMSVQPDHIHMIVQLKPSDSISGVVQILNGVTSRVIRKEFSELEEFLLGDSFWADGYFAETIGQVSEDIVKRYIRDLSDVAEGV